MKLSLFLVAHILSACAAIALYVTWAEHSGHNVLSALRRNELMQTVFIRDGYRELSDLLEQDGNDTFETTWDFDSGVALSRSMFNMQNMFGENKYTLRPNTGIYNVVVWSGLRNVPLVLAATPALSKTLAKNTLHRSVYFETDEHGFKTTGFPWHEGALTVFFLGDSFTEGLWMTPEETFSHQFAVKVRDRFPSIAPVNLGVNGYSALEMDWMLERYAPLFRPYLVIANLFPNDVDANYLNAIVGVGIPEENYAKLFSFLERMQKYCSLHGMTFVVAVIPAKEQFKELMGLSVFHERVANWCRRSRVNYLDPRRYFSERGGEKLYFSWDPHFTSQGHLVYADFLSNQLAPFLAQTLRTAK